MSEVRKKAVRLKAASEVEIQHGWRLPAGVYPATLQQIVVPIMDGLKNWTAPEYFMDLTEDQISRFMGEKFNPNILYAEYDVTKFVRLGQLTVVS